MMDDMSKESELYKPTNHWNKAVEELIEDITNEGLTNFRSIPSFLMAFIPTYSFPNYYSQTNNYYKINNTLNEILPEETEIEKSQKQSTRKKLNTRLNNFLSGRLLAYSDYRVFLSTYENVSPFTYKASESKIGNPVEQFEFDKKKYSRSFLNYLLGLNYLKSIIIKPKINKVLEIGGGYGTLGEILLSDSRNNCKYINIDIPPTSHVATYYLKNIIGKDNVGDYLEYRNKEIINIDKELDKYKAIVLCSWQLPKLEGEIDLFVNYHSFAEMEPHIVRNYCKIVCNLKPKYILLRNLKEGKQLRKGNNHYGVKTPILSSDYNSFLSGYNLVGENTHIFGNLTEDGFHSEVKVFKRC